MCVTLLVHTILLVIVWVQTYTPTNLVRPGDEVGMSDEELKQRELGSKLVLVTEHLTLIVLWCVKACMLIMYSRLTYGYALRMLPAILEANLDHLIG